MATITKFEELEIWQLSRKQADDFYQFSRTTNLGKDLDLKNQMNSSSGSVMIALPKFSKDREIRNSRISSSLLKGPMANSVLSFIVVLTGIISTH
jgi:hypothetical protein